MIDRDKSVLDHHLACAEDALSEALSLIPNEYDYYAIDTELAALVDQVGQLRADLQLVPRS